MSNDNDNSMDAQATDRLAAESRGNRLDLTWKPGNLFRPNIVYAERRKEDDTWACLGQKYCLPTPVELSSDVVLKEVLLDDQDNLALKQQCNYPVASHGGFLCAGYPGIVDPSTHSIMVCKFCNPGQAPEISLCRWLPHLCHGREYMVGLMHMRVDDNGQGVYKILVAGRYTTDDQSCYTYVYHSKTNEWKMAEKPNFEGNLNVEDLFFQNGAFLQKPDSELELLFCLSTLDAMGNRGILVYNFTTQCWSSYHMPIDSEVAPTGGSNVWQPLGIEEYGGMIFLFSEKKCYSATNDVHVFIHKLNPDHGDGDPKNFMWKEVLQRKREILSSSSEFISQFSVYPGIACKPLEDDISRCNGCVFAFSYASEKSGVDYVTIHTLPNGPILSDSASCPQWSDKIIKLPITSSQRNSRGPNWTGDEERGFRRFRNEALRKGSKRGADMWAYVSNRLWEWGGYDRSPKQCQHKGDTLKRPQLDPAAASGPRISKKSNRSELTASTAGGHCFKDNFARGMKVLQKNSQALTDEHISDLFEKIVELDFLRESKKNPRNADNFRKVIDMFESESFIKIYTPSKCFEILRKSLDTDMEVLKKTH